MRIPGGRIIRVYNMHSLHMHIKAQVKSTPGPVNNNWLTKSMPWTLKVPITVYGTTDIKINKINQ